MLNYLDTILKSDSDSQSGRIAQFAIGNAVITTVWLWLQAAGGDDKRSVIYSHATVSGDRKSKNAFCCITDCSVT